MPSSSPTRGRSSSWSGGGARSSPIRPARSREDDLDSTSYGVWSAVPVRGGITTDRLVSAAGVPAGRLVGILAALEADGLVTRQEGRWRKASASARDDDGLLGELARGP